MTTEVFFQRCPRVLWQGDALAPPLARLPLRAGYIVFGDLRACLDLGPEFFKAAHDRLAQALAVPGLSKGKTHEARCRDFLGEPYDSWNVAHGTVDRFLKARFSLIEVMVALVEDQVATARRAAEEASLLSKLLRAPDGALEEAVRALPLAIDELNARFEDAKAGLIYRDGALHA
ncbi:hypothetical protein [Rhodospirillum rubrum]|uniref:Uncharacterized protein n=1 Tax=Rhodospirillum rubrum (strain ATCC 11170 / ATH 1.1.1 / DSM 467 / LMG 4362 / NCIMB 8255 / S1) TaxID=269796 RepID=Q2RUY8_RHORT|nr:hypothetical protein [Rhodospirillum rubrum]ABC22057.1 hypothetical protein Rru_A1256 [Rhodospirillum rubrum ATCC 11170]AEO47769.1 hypothetical protein F11_06495 [Rhodospirillum rubrum F11]MBK5953640.1 hypothetical protein [Rhodospirillum rubrum]QXG81710.1 hypothetical protein KUL73_06550 [Rhodospirillum rubrum]HAP99634.1 hypothetical protein [Rhodospirillum rubrum]